HAIARSESRISWAAYITNIGWKSALREAYFVCAEATGLDDYWNAEEKEGGTYVQVESVALSRTIPAILAWLINPVVRNIPRTVLSNLLNATRRAVAERDRGKTRNTRRGRRGRTAESAPCRFQNHLLGKLDALGTLAAS